MNDEVKMILQMLSDGKISADQAANLLKAISETQPRTEQKREFSEPERDAVREATRMARQEAKEAARMAKDALREELREVRETAREAARQAKEEAREQLRVEREKIREASRVMRDHLHDEAEEQDEELADLEDILEHEDADEGEGKLSIGKGFGRLGSMLGGLFSGLSGESYAWEEEISGEFPDAKNPKIIIRGVNGRVSVGVGEDPKWRLTVEKSINASSRAEAKELSADLYSVDSSSEGLLIVAKKVFGQSRTAHFHLQLPKDMVYNLDLSSTNGSVRVRDITADTLRATTTNGKVEVMCVARDISLASTNGRVELSGCGEKVQCRTVNGRIAVVCPLPVPGEMSLNTVNGGIAVRMGATKHLGLRFNGSNTHGRVSANMPGLEVNLERRTVGRRVRVESRGDYSKWINIEARSVHGPVSIEHI